MTQQLRCDVNEADEAEQRRLERHPELGHARAVLAGARLASDGEHLAIVSSKIEMCDGGKGLSSKRAQGPQRSWPCSPPGWTSSHRYSGGKRDLGGCRRPQCGRQHSFRRDARQPRCQSQNYCTWLSWGCDRSFYRGSTHSTKRPRQISRAHRGRGPVSGSCGLDGGPLGVELLEVEEADEAVARACLGASIARVLYHAAVIGTGLRGKGEEGGGQEEEHRGGCQDTSGCQKCCHSRLPATLSRVPYRYGVAGTCCRI